MIKVILVAFLLQAGIACALTGNELYDQLESKETYKLNAGLSYITGIFDANAFFYLDSKYGKVPTPVKAFICPPENATYGQAKDIIHKYLKENPDVRHISAGMISIATLRNAWPCDD